MSIRMKIVGFACLVFLGTVVVTIIATITLVQAEYIKIEANNVRKDTARAVDAVGNRVDQLGVKIADWASWDDTYQFMQDHNEAYLNSNIQPESLQSLAINIILYYNAQGDLVSSKSVDLATGNDVPVPAELLNAFEPPSQFLARSPTDKRQGVLGTTTYPLLVAARPILRTDNSGPARGTLVFAQYLDGTSTAELARLTHLSLSYVAPQSQKCEVGICTHTNDGQTITGVGVIDDMYGHPVVLAQVTEPRDIYSETSRTLIIYVSVILTAGLLSVIAAFVTVNLIMRRDHIIRLKNEFFSIASHELRTPLTAIRGNSVLLEKLYGPHNDAEFTATVADIHEASVRLIKIVNDFLDLARLERDQMPLTQTVLKLKDPVAVVVKELQTVAAEKGLYIKTDLPAHLPPVWADDERVQQVIYNLAGNAMKFTATGGITIKAKPHSHKLTVYVVDTGRGMSPEQQKKLFQSFQQTRDQDATIGSGLGLYISKLLVERMSGHIWVERSEEGKGTSIAFTLPLAPPHSRSLRP